MKKEIKSLVCALLVPLALSGKPSDISRLGFNWEISFQENVFSSSNQFDLGNQDFSLAGSLNSQETSGADYGLSATAKSVGKTFGKYSGKKSNSYFNGTRKTRNDSFYAGIGFQRHSEDLETEFFAGAKLGNLLLSSSKSAYNTRESSAYFEFPTGTVLGLTKTTDEGIGSSGIYYSHNNIGAQVNFAGENSGSKLSFNNLLSKMDEFLYDKSEKFGAEIGYGKETGGIFGLGYNVHPSKGPIQFFNFSISKTETSSKGTILENNFKIRTRNYINLKDPNPATIRLRFETGSNRGDFGLDLRY